jgi:hypothetical protein
MQVEKIDLKREQKWLEAQKSLLGERLAKQRG